MTYLYIVAGALGSLVGCAITAYTLTESHKAAYKRLYEAHAHERREYIEKREEECRACQTRKRF